MPPHRSAATEKGHHLELTAAAGRNSRPFGRPRGTKPGIAAWLASKFSLWTRMEDPCGNDLAPLSCGAFFARGVPGAQPRSPGVVTPSKAARPPAAGRGYSRLCEPGQLLSTRGAELIPRPCAQATMTTLFNWTDVGAPAPSLAIPYLNWTWGPLGAWGLCFSAHP